MMATLVAAAMGMGIVMAEETAPIAAPAIEAPVCCPPPARPVTIQKAIDAIAYGPRQPAGRGSSIGKAAHGRQTNWRRR